MIKYIIFLLIFPCFLQGATSPLTEIIEETIRAKGSTNVPLIISIGGCPGIGKSTLAGILQKELNNKGITSVILSLDHYGLSQELRKQFTNELDPRRMQWNKLHDTLQTIKAGEKRITKPFIDQQTKKMGTETLQLDGIQCVIFEGTYTLSNIFPMDYRSYADRAIYLETSLENIYNWKWEREFKKPTPRTEREFFHHMNAIFADFIFHVYPSRKSADYIIQIDHSHHYSLLNAKAIAEVPSPNFDPIRLEFLSYEPITVIVGY